MFDMKLVLEYSLVLYDFHFFFLAKLSGIPSVAGAKMENYHTD